MSSSRMLLRTYVRMLVEAAVSTQAASSHGLALLKSKNTMVLYDPKHYAESIESDGVESVSSDTSGIIGYIVLAPGDPGSAWGAAEVSASAAQKGYGPMMYDLAMSSAGTPIMPDRSSLSPKAANVWKYYDEKRPDVKKMPLDDIDNPKTPDPQDDARVWDCEKYGGVSVDDSWGDDEDDVPKQCAVNKAYTGAHVDSSRLATQHSQFMKKLGDKGKSFEEALLWAAQSFFDELSDAA